MQAYDYSAQIKTPDTLGVSDKGSTTALSNDIDALQGYIDVVMSGNSKAQRASPLGNKYFMDTGSQCTDLQGNTQPRFAYINNIPDGSLGIGRGLVPGIQENITQINPMAIFSAFSTVSPCQKITLATRDTNNKAGEESRYVTQSDIESYNPCWFPDRKNPVTNAKCEGMQSRCPPPDPAVRLYLAAVGGLAVFMVYRFFNQR